jgi:hypothetical protein
MFPHFVHRTLEPDGLSSLSSSLNFLEQRMHSMTMIAGPLGPDILAGEFAASTGYAAPGCHVISAKKFKTEPASSSLIRQTGRLYDDPGSVSWAVKGG